VSSIFGILHFDGGPVARRDLDRMGGALGHRGGDGGGVWTGGVVGLGQGLRLVTHEDRLERQPLYDQTSGLALVADLRLDNREALADALQIGAAALAALPDSALLLGAYKRWGADCAAHLLGDFAFAVWDGPARKLVLGRDHLGQRGLVFHRGERGLVFASEPRALWTHPDVPRGLTERGVARMLLHDMSPQPAGEGLFEGIESLPGAAVAVIDGHGAIVQSRYWTPAPDPRHLGHDEPYYVAAYRSVLGEAVACRLRRNIAPSGLMLSGGFDSSAIAALSGPVMREKGERLICASSVMPADYHGDIRHARKWVEACRRDMPHIDVRYLTREGMNLLDEMEGWMIRNEGRAGPYAVIREKLCGVIAQGGARVVMDGLGGDQGLNPRGGTALAGLLAAGRLRRFAREFRDHQRLTGHSFWRTLKVDLLMVLLPDAIVRLWRGLRRGFSPAWGDEPVAEDFARRMLAADAVDKATLRGASRPPPLDVRRHMVDAFVRRMSRDSGDVMSHGLQRVQPFFDKRVVELALAVPADLHVKNGRNRYLACRALKDLFPPEFQTRSRKNDDQIPDFQRIVKSVERQLLAELERMEACEAMGRYFDFAKIRKLLAARGPDDHASGGERETHMAIGAFVAARFIHRFRGYNS
jgi:asparagine synthase (glutamine-hydrolysing)